MNRIYNIIWSQAKEKWIVVSEKVKSNGGVPKSSLPSLALLTALLAAGAPAYALDPAALPSGGQIAAGTGSIAYSDTANKMTVSQTSKALIANWESFNIGQQSAVRFDQPGSSAVALNRIADSNPTQILGSLSSNGNIFLVNPSGIVFGNSAQVDVGGLVASSLDINDADFLAGSYRLQTSGAAGSILNSGSINAPGGVVALIAPQVTNDATGSITTPLGSTALAAGSQVSVDFKGDGLINLTVDSGVVNALAENKGYIGAQGGLVVLSAKSAENVMLSAVNNSGVIVATGLHQRDGKIILDSNDGLTSLSGTLDVSGANCGSGGQIIAVGGVIDINDGVNPNGNEMLLVAPTVANIRVRVDGVTQQLEFTPDSSHNEGEHNSAGHEDKLFSGEVSLGANNEYADYRVGTAATKAIIVETGNGSKVYDGTTVAENLAINTIGVRDSGYSADGLTFVTENKNVGSGYSILPGSDKNQLSSDYAVGYYTGQYAITPRTVTLSGITADNKIYDGNTVATVRTENALFDNIVAGESIGVTTTGAFDDKNVGWNKQVTLESSYSGNKGTELSNYIIEGQGSTEASITPRTVTVSGITAENKVYDGNTIAQLQTGNASFKNIVDGEQIGIRSWGTFDGKNVGENKLVSLRNSYLGNQETDLSNYIIEGQDYTQASITPRTITVSGITADNKIYDGNTIAQVQTSKALFSNIVDGERIGVTASGSFDNKNVGVDRVVALKSNYIGNQETDLSNYIIQNQSAAQASITPRTIRVSGITADNKTYDGNTVAQLQTENVLFSNIVDGENIGIASTGNFDSKNVGTDRTVALSSSYSGNQNTELSNYRIQDQASTQASITPRTVTVSGISADNKVYDGNTVAQIQTGNALVSNVVDGERIGVNATGSFDSKNIGVDRVVALNSSYAGNQSTELSNYTIQDQASTQATITPRAVTVSGITAGNKIYDGNTLAQVQTANALVSNVVAGESIGLTTTGTFDSKNVGNNRVVTLNSNYSGNQTTDLGNYTIQEQLATQANIVHRTVTVSGISASNKIYNGNTLAEVQTGNVLISNVVAGESIGLTTAGTFDSKNVGTNRLVALSNSFSGDQQTDLSNYIIQDQLSTQASITPRVVTVSGITASDKTYDRTTTAQVQSAGAIFNNIVDGESIGLSVSGTFGDKNAAFGKTVNLVSSYSGADLANYSVVDQSNTTASIMKLPINISGITAYNKNYDGTVTAITNSNGATGWLAGDQLLVSSVGVFDTELAGTGKLVTLASSYSGADVNNYAITSQASTTANILQVATQQQVTPPVTPPVVGAPAITSATGLVVQYVAAPTVSGTGAGVAVPGEIDVTIPAASLSTGGGASFTVPLPEDVQTAAIAGGESVSLVDANGNSQPLPSWITYDSVAKVFKASSVTTGDLAQTVTVQLKIGTKTWKIVISSQQ